MSDISPEFTPPQPNTEQGSAGKNTDKSVKSPFKKLVGKAILAGLVLTPGIIHDSKVPEPNINKTQTPAVSELPAGMPSANIDLNNISLPPTPEPTSVHTPTPQIPTQEVSASPQPSQQEQSGKKELMPYYPSITIVDATAVPSPSHGSTLKGFISNESMMIDILGDNYVSKEQLIREFGLDYSSKWNEVVQKHPQALVRRFVDLYFNHGRDVVSVAEDTLQSSGLQSAGINMLPLQIIFDKDSIALIKDTSGNPGVSLNFDPKRIIKLLENNPSRVINGSFQVGNVELFQETKVKTEVIPKYNPDDPSFSGNGLGGELDGKEVLYQEAVRMTRTGDGKLIYYDKEGKEITPISYEDLEKRKLENSEVIEHKSTELIIEGAYTKAKAMENLPKLFEICNAYPNKFFVFALGNEGEDIREAMDALKDKVPNNLLIVAEWVKAPAYNYEGPAMVFDNDYRLVHGPVLGPDIYGYNKGSNHPHGSSFTAPEFSVEIDKLLKNGLSFEQAKAKILASSDIHSIDLADGTKYTARVFNPSKLHEK